MITSRKPLGMLAVAGALLMAAALAGCGSDSAANNGGPAAKNGEAPKASGGGITAQGSSFIQPFLLKCFDEYNNKAGFQINYTGGGSSAGVQSVTSGTFPFGASDAPLSDTEAQASKDKILNLPLVLGSVAIVYNVPDVKTGLKLDGPLLADIFMCKVAKWNDSRIAALNPDVKLPDLAITVEVRADGSGTTFVLSDYLSRVSPAWKTTMGVNKKLKWDERAQAWPHSDNLANNTKQTPGAISYAELSWATKSGLSYAVIKNSAGKFIGPEPAGATAAAAAVPLPADFRVSIVNAPGADSYPISSYSFGLLRESLVSDPHGKEIVDALKFVISDGQQFAEPNYAKLPDAVVKAVQAALDTVKVQ